jgi:hypothetical protein
MKMQNAVLVKSRIKHADALSLGNIIVKACIGLNTWNIFLY